MTSSQFSDVDEYGFKRGNTFNYATLEKVMSSYLGVLARRRMRWEDYMKGRESEPLIVNRQLKRFIRKGVPGNLRKTVWLKTSGAWDARQTERNLYADLLRMPYDKEIADSIKIDLPRTFPDNIFFQSVQHQLFNILIAFSNYDRRVGYCQGINYIAGIILLVTKDEEATFWLLKHLIQEVTPNYHIKTMSGLVTDIGVLSELIRVNVPEVHLHVAKMGLSWTVIVTKWFICIYAEVLPTETVLRIWDCIFSEGAKIIFRVALTLVLLFRADIVATTDLTELSNVFKSMGRSEMVLDCHRFMKLVFEMTQRSVTRGIIENYRKVVGLSALN